MGGLPVTRLDNLKIWGAGAGAGAVQFSVAQCIAVQCIAVQCSAMQSTVTWLSPLGESHVSHGSRFTHLHLGVGVRHFYNHLCTFSDQRYFATLIKMTQDCSLLYHVSCNMSHFPCDSLPIFYDTTALYTLSRQSAAEKVWCTVAGIHTALRRRQPALAGLTSPDIIGEKLEATDVRWSWMECFISYFMSTKAHT